MSVARDLRSTLEQAIGQLPDIVMLIIGLGIAYWALAPVLGVVGQVRNVVSGQTQQ